MAAQTRVPALRRGYAGLGEEIGSVHKEFFAQAPPAGAIYEVAQPADPRMLMEIEAAAIVA